MKFGILDWVNKANIERTKMDRTEFERAVRRLAAARQNEKLAKERYQALWNEFQQQEHVREVVSIQTETMGTTAAVLEELKLLAMEAYAADGNKDIHPAVRIKMYKIYDYADSDAIEWCKANLPIVFTFDAKKFVDYLKICTPTDVPFVRFLEEPRPSIATDLSEYLEDENA